MRRWIAIASALLLASCSGAGSATRATGPNPAAQSTPTALTATSFVFGPLPATSSAHRHATYITASVASVQIALTKVNGAAPAAGITASVKTNVNLASCPCTVPGPAVPPGSDVFTLTAYDAQNGGGNVISIATPTLTIVADQPNSNGITLNGVPASFSLSPPAATAGTAFAATTFSVTVKDADGNTIMGAYANPVTLTNGDASGATTLATSGADGPPANELLSSSDTATLAYTGLAMAPATLGAAASGATSGSGSFAPSLQPIVSSLSALDLYTTSGGGSTESFTASEVGWTNAPYNKNLGLGAAAGCSTIGTASPASGTSFTATAVGAPVAGSCNLTLSDGAGQTQVVALQYVNASQTFSYNGSVQTFNVPAGITQVTITTNGAGGGAGDGGAPGHAGTSGGNGASETGTFAVTPGGTLAVIAGGGGGASPVTSSAGSGGGGGGSLVFDSGGAVLIAAGGGGGGATNGGGIDATFTSTAASATTGGAGGASGAGGNPGAPGGGGGGGTVSAGHASTSGAAGGGVNAAGGGGIGGTAAGSNNGAGGYGGGGGSAFGGGGGGGGYSGGGGGGGGSGNSHGGGGGGSSNSGTNTSTAVGALGGAGSTGPDIPGANGSVNIVW